MNYKEAYKTIEKFVNKNEFEGSDLLKEIFSDVNKEISDLNEVQIAKAKKTEDVPKELDPFEMIAQKYEK